MKRLTLSLTGFLFSIFAAASAFSAEAHIVSVEGQVQVRGSAAAEWKNAEKDAVLGQGYEILTGSNAVCEFVIGTEKNAVKIHADSHAVLTSLEPVKIELKSGKIFSLVRHIAKGSSFEVHTPTAMAAARGTGWGQTSEVVLDFEDSVYVRGSGGQDTTLEEGKGIHIGSDGSLGDTFDISGGDRSQWEDFKKSLSVGNGDGALGEDNQNPNEELLDAKAETKEHEDELKNVKGELEEKKGGSYTGG